MKICNKCFSKYDGYLCYPCYDKSFNDGAILKFFIERFEDENIDYLPPTDEQIKKREYFKQYYARNREKLLNKTKEWQLNNPNKVKKSYEQHYSNNKEVIIERVKSYNKGKANI